MSRCETIEVPTLQYIHDTETAVYDEDIGEVPRDIVLEALAHTEGAYGDFESAVHDRIWNDYRFRMFGTCDADMFARILGDRLSAEAYTAVMSIQAVVDMTDRTLLGGLRTITRGSRTDTRNSTDEDLPDNFAAAYTYPTARGSDTNVYGEQTDTETDMRGSAELARETMDALRDPLDALMRAISGCWLNRW